MKPNEFYLLLANGYIIASFLTEKILDKILIWVVAVCWLIAAFALRKGVEE